MSFTCYFAVYLILVICDVLIQQGLEAMAHCITGGSAKVSCIIVNNNETTFAWGAHTASL